MTTTKQISSVFGNDLAYFCKNATFSLKQRFSLLFRHFAKVHIFSEDLHAIIFSNNLPFILTEMA
jgi:hypothetical protein